jgi:hypothetical protein
MHSVKNTGKYRSPSHPNAGVVPAGDAGFDGLRSLIQRIPRRDLWQPVSKIPETIPEETKQINPGSGSRRVTLLTAKPPANNRRYAA